jgi:hypothetical protein
VSANGFDARVSKQVKGADSRAVEDEVIVGQFAKARNLLPDKLDSFGLQQTVEYRETDAGVDGERGKRFPEPGC